ncbi:MAG: hypothetical protein EOO38_07935 [Cytophagaceae bacterium]|nr:MAG: hypothetical protein EOO38_07935 [Cytophagaceae bacterium]
MSKTKLQYLKQVGQEIDLDLPAMAEAVEELMHARTVVLAHDRLDSIDAYVQNWVLYIARARRRMQ